MEIDLLGTELVRSDRRRRVTERRALTDSQRETLNAFGREYFDGPTGYGGYHYDGRHAATASDMVGCYGLTAESSVLDVGCAKGFMLREFVRLGIRDVRGCDISSYALDHAHAEVADRLCLMSADVLFFDDRSFDLVYAVDVLHNLEPDAADAAIQEVSRVSRAHAFIQLASFENGEQECNLREWGVTVRTFRGKDEWRRRLRELDYRGDFYFKTF